MAAPGVEKACTTCKVEQPLAQFGPHKRSRDGHAYICRSCDRKRALRYVKNRPPEQVRARTIRRHGITVEQYDAMAEGGCNGCGEAHETYVIDHDHSCCPGPYSCGKCVRGVLCRRCNLILGQVEDQPDTLVALAAYLMRDREPCLT